MADKKSILIAEDEESLREMNRYFVSELLGEFNVEGDYQIEEFSHGRVLANRLERNVGDVALVISDNNCGAGPSGSQIVEQYSDRVNIGLIYFGSQRIGKEALEKGAVFCISKPYTFDEFKKEVSQALGLGEQSTLSSP